MRAGARAICATAPTTFPLKVSANGRYVVDAQGRPFLFCGESAWPLLTIPLAEALAHLDQIAAGGFNSVLLWIPGYAQNAPLIGATGHYAFSTPDDFTSSPVAGYWAHADTILAACAVRGIVAKVSPLYFGYNGGGDQGWWPIVATKSTGQIQAYAAWAAQRLSYHKNIIWDLLGDYVPADTARWNAVVDGVRAVTPTRLLTGEPGHNHNTDEYQPTSGGNWDLNFVYSPVTYYDQCLTAWNNNVGPAFCGELYYERRTNPTITVRQFRGQWWFAITSGALAGCMGGNEYSSDLDLDLFPDGTGNSPYTAIYGDPGRISARIWRAFCASKPYHRLVPDQASAFITSGRGTYGSDTYITAAVASGPQNFALAYVPGGGSHVAALSGFSGPVTIRYLDPTNGALTAATGGPFAASGTTTLNPVAQLGNNAAGDTDWVEVFES